MIFRKYGFLFVLGLLLAFIAWQARTGIFRRKNPGEPANKYMRQIMESPQLTEADAQVLRDQFGNAHQSPSGLRYILRQPGAGAPPAVGAEALVRYEAYLMNGTKIDSSNGKPIPFRVGVGRVIKGWDEALVSMHPGEKRTLLVPWWLAYGEEGRSPVPPRAMLRFEMELVEVR